MKKNSSTILISGHFVKNADFNLDSSYDAFTLRLVFFLSWLLPQKSITRRLHASLVSLEKFLWGENINLQKIRSRWIIFALLSALGFLQGTPLRDLGMVFQVRGKIPACARITTAECLSGFSDARGMMLPHSIKWSSTRSDADFPMARANDNDEASRTCNTHLPP
jgi:hypothetical protein